MLDAQFYIACYFHLVHCDIISRLLAAVEKSAYLSNSCSFVGSISVPSSLFFGVLQFHYDVSRVNFFYPAAWDSLDVLNLRLLSFNSEKLLAILSWLFSPPRSLSLFFCNSDWTYDRPPSLYLLWLLMPLAFSNFFLSELKFR